MIDHSIAYYKKSLFIIINNENYSKCSIFQIIKNLNQNNSIVYEYVALGSLLSAAIL